MQQATFDFNRGDKLGLLDDLCIPDAPGIRGSTAKTVLRVIDGFGERCFASSSTMMSRTSLTLRTIKRALHRLEELGMIVPDERKRMNPNGSVTKVRRIDWTVMAARVDSQMRGTSSTPSIERTMLGSSSQRVPNATSASGASSARLSTEIPTTEHRAMVSEHGAMVSEHGAMVSEHGARVAPNTKEPQRTATNQRTSEPNTAAAAFDFSLDWKPLEQRMRALGVSQPGLGLRAAREARMAPAEVAAICDEFERHRSRFASAGALVARLRYGGWSVELPDAAKVAMAAPIERAKDLERQRSSLFARFRDEARARLGRRLEDADFAEIETRVANVLGC